MGNRAVIHIKRASWRNIDSASAVRVASGNGSYIIFNLSTIHHKGRAAAGAYAAAMAIIGGCSSVADDTAAVKIHFSRKQAYSPTAPCVGISAIVIARYVAAVHIDNGWVCLFRASHAYTASRTAGDDATGEDIIFPFRRCVTDGVDSFIIIPLAVVKHTLRAVADIQAAAL